MRRPSTTCSSTRQRPDNHADRSATPAAPGDGAQHRGARRTATPGRCDRRGQVAASPARGGASRSASARAAWTCMRYRAGRTGLGAAPPRVGSISVKMPSRSRWSSQLGDRTIDDGEVGGLVVTTLTRRHLPIVARYRTGDLIQLSRHGGQCGRPMRGPRVGSLAASPSNSSCAACHCCQHISRRSSGAIQQWRTTSCRCTTRAAKRSLPWNRGQTRRSRAKATARGSPPRLPRICGGPSGCCSDATWSPAQSGRSGAGRRARRFEPPVVLRVGVGRPP